MLIAEIYTMNLTGLRPGILQSRWVACLHEVYAKHKLSLSMVNAYGQTLNSCFPLSINSNGPGQGLAAFRFLPK